MCSPFFRSWIILGLTFYIIFVCVCDCCNFILVTRMKGMYYHVVFFRFFFQLIMWRKIMFVTMCVCVTANWSFLI